MKKHHSVFKYQFLIGDEVLVSLPKGAQILHVAQQPLAKADLCLWAKVDINETTRYDRRLLVYGTGHPMPENPGEFLGTVLANGGALVWHVFDAGEVRGT